MAPHELRLLRLTLLRSVTSAEVAYGGRVPEQTQAKGKEGLAGG